MGLCVRFWLSVADDLLCLFIFFPLAIFHWRGTWDLQDYYFVPNNLVVSSWISFGAGSGLTMLTFCLKPVILKWTSPIGSAKYIVASRLWLYIHGWAVMCYWRGTWNLMDNYLTEGWINSLLIYVGCQILSFATLTARTNVGLPFALNIDTEDDLMAADIAVDIDTSVTWKFVLAGFYTQFIIITSNIAVWRGIWNVIDAFLFPHNHLTSFVSSLALGYLILLQLFLLEFPASVTSTKLDAFPKKYKIIFEDIIVLVATWATLLVWRGAWELVVHYVIPDKLVGGWVCHWIGTLSMLILQIFRNVATNGIDRDGAYAAGEGIYPTHYLRYFFANKFDLKETQPEDEYTILDASTVVDPDALDAESGIFTIEGSLESSHQGELVSRGRDFICHERDIISSVEDSGTHNPRLALVRQLGVTGYGSADERERIDNTNHNTTGTSTV